MSRHLRPTFSRGSFGAFRVTPRRRRRFAAQKKHTNRKLFYEDRYKIPRDLETYAIVADAMRRDGRSHEALERVVEQVELYATADASHRTTG